MVTTCRLPSILLVRPPSARPSALYSAAIAKSQAAYQEAIGRARSSNVSIHLCRVKKNIKCLFFGRRGVCLQVSVPFVSQKYGGTEVESDRLRAEVSIRLRAEVSIPSVVFTYQTRAPPSSGIENDLGYIPYRLAACTLTITWWSHYFNFSCVCVCVWWV